MSSRSRRLAVASFALVVAVAGAGCLRMRREPVPIAMQQLAAPCAAPVDTLVVLLPGAYDDASDFVDRGFVAALRSRGIAADIALVDATVPYYRDRTIVTRLDDDVIAPARKRGIRHVWIAGISLGGLGGLIYANERRGVVDGVIAIAPYLGEPGIEAEVAALGGLARWAPPDALDDDDHRLWRWLKTLTVARPSDAPLPVLYLGFGVDDRFARSHRRLAAAMPPGQVFTAPGGHDWPPWQATWSAMLDAAPLPRDPSCRADAADAPTGR